MFISKSKYEELLKEKEELKNQLAIKKAYITSLDENYTIAVKQNSKLLDENLTLKANQVLSKGVKSTKVVDDTEDNSFKFKTQAVKNHLLNKGNITSWEAIQKYNVTRLSAVIFELKRKGMDITTTPETNGKSRFVRYHLNKSVK
jgi:predicted nuclease with TOPRIM domain